MNGAIEFHVNSRSDTLTSSLSDSQADDSSISHARLPQEFADLIPRLQQLDVRFSDRPAEEDQIDVRMLLTPREEPDEIGRFSGYRVLEYLCQVAWASYFEPKIRTRSES